MLHKSVPARSSGMQFVSRNMKHEPVSYPNAYSASTSSLADAQTDEIAPGIYNLLLNHLNAAIFIPLP